MEVLVTEHITAQDDPLTHGPLWSKGPLGFPREQVEKHHGGRISTKTLS